MKSKTQTEKSSRSGLKTMFLSNYNKAVSLPEKILIRISDVLVIISIIMVFVMMVLAVLDVILVSVFKVPFIGATEVVQILNVGIVLALAGGTLNAQHVTVDFVAEKFKNTPRYVLQLVADFINLIVLVLLTYASYKYIFVIYNKKAVFSLLKIQQWPFVVLMSLGLFGGILAMIVMICQHIREHKMHAGVDEMPVILPWEVQTAGKEDPLKVGEVIVHMDDIPDKNEFARKDGQKGDADE